MDFRLPLANTPASILQNGDMDRRDLLPYFLLRFDRPQTRRAYTNDLLQFFDSSEITLEAARGITFVHVNEHIASLESVAARPSTIKRRLAALRGFFSWLHALDLIEKNPADRHLVRRIRSSRRQDATIVFLTAQQSEALLQATSEAGAAAVRDYALILTLLYCVLRRSEAAAMNAEHVHPLGAYWVLDLPATKGGADQYVKIPAHVVETIEHVKDHYGFRSGPLWRSVSNRNHNGRLTPHSIYTIVRETAIRAGLETHIGAHTLRHTGCTLAIESGASLQQVQAHARHKNLETTMMYVHQRDRLRDSAADYIHIKTGIDARPDRLDQ